MKYLIVLIVLLFRICDLIIYIVFLYAQINDIYITYLFKEKHIILLKRFLPIPGT